MPSFTVVFSFRSPRTTAIYTLSLHAALPISDPQARVHAFCHAVPGGWHAMGVMLSAAGSLRWLRDALGSGSGYDERSEEHTSELQSHHDLVCRLLLEKKNNNIHSTNRSYIDS